MAKTEPTPNALVTELYDLAAEIAVLQERKASKDAELIGLGDGDYIEVNEREPGTGKRRATVVTPSAPKPSYSLYPDALKAAFLAARGVKKATPELNEEFAAKQEEKVRKLAGKHFGVLFDRVVVYRPAPAYPDLVARLLSTATATAAKLIALCQVTKNAGKAHVKLPDKPKNADAQGEEEA